MREIPLTRGYVALVDDADYDRVMAVGHWRATPIRNTVYAQHNTRNAKGRRTTAYLHRFILGIEDTNVQVDHRNHNGLDNRRANLRVASLSQNAANRAKLKGTTSRFKGVSWSKEKGKWRAYITIKRKTTLHLGYFDSEIDAACAYYRAACEHFGEFKTTSLSAAYVERRRSSR